MKCLYCGYLKTMVLDSRGREGFTKVILRLCCPKCQRRATTYEISFDSEHKQQTTTVKINLSDLYQSLVKQLRLLEKSIQLINPARQKIE